MLSNINQNENQNQSLNEDSKSTKSKDKISLGNLSEQETTVKSLNMSGELISCLNEVEKLEELKKKEEQEKVIEKKEPTENQILYQMFVKYHERYIKKWK